MLTGDTSTTYFHLCDTEHCYNGEYVTGSGGELPIIITTTLEEKQFSQTLSDTFLQGYYVPRIFPLGGSQRSGYTVCGDQLHMFKE